MTTPLPAWLLVVLVMLATQQRPASVRPLPESETTMSDITARLTNTRREADPAMNRADREDAVTAINEATECVARCLLEIDCLNAEGETLHAELDAERALADAAADLLSDSSTHTQTSAVADWQARYRKARQ